jgi:hypothetical protein
MTHILASEPVADAVLPSVVLMKRNTKMKTTDPLGQMENPNLDTVELPLGVAIAVELVAVPNQHVTEHHSLA